jgi:branched-chain amino acid transport system substrate-binding protein
MAVIRLATLFAVIAIPFAMPGGLLSPSTARAQTTPTIAAPLTIGVLEDMTGVYSDITGKAQVIAAQMAADDFGGTVLGRPIRIVSADHGNKADIGASIVRNWFDNDGVAMIAGLGNSAVALAAQTVAAQKHKIDIVTSAGSSDLSGVSCVPTGFHWAFDTYSTSKVVSSSITQNGGNTWYYIAADYTFGTLLENTSTQFVKAFGGKVLGSSKVPLGTQDFSSYLLDALSSGAKVIGLANGGGDTTNAIKQAVEFGLVKQGRKLAALSMYVQDVDSLGTTAAGLFMAESFYWDADDATRAWSKRIFAKTHEMPNMLQAGIYSGVLHYLKAVRQAGTDDGPTVARIMHEMPVNDFYSHNVQVRADGQVMRPMYLLQVKQPADQHGEWDLLKIVKTVPGKDAFMPASESRCPLLKQATQ